MQQDLWRLRHQKRWTINELANESGVPGLSIHEYEQGKPIRDADLPKLASALGVPENTIKVYSSPKPSKPAGGKQKRTRPFPQDSLSRPATQNQIDHLIALAEKLGQSRADLETDIGKSLEKMSGKEIKTWLTQFTVRIKERKEQIDGDLSGLKRWRAHLPEGVDSFELEYLLEKKQAAVEITFTLFDGSRFSGRIVGFSPYNITLLTNQNEETTLQKLAIAYYTTPAGKEPME